jgi:glycosyltransferase involved in cell wall biosynthesis
MVSVLIPTKNEELDLPGCLASVAWCDDVHVYDSGSADETVQVAKRMGASVTIRSYEPGLPVFGGNEAEHKIWALHYIPFKYSWVLHLDADERVTPELALSIRRAVESPGDKVAFRIQRRDFFLSTWLRHVQTSPLYMRLFRPEKMHYERLVNPVSIADGPVGELSGYLDHFPFSKGMSHWVSRHNSYSSLEAEQIISNHRKRSEFSIAKAFTASDFHERRYHQKELFYRLPGRPLLKFAYSYIARRGFLDGRAGLTYALLQAFYEYLIVLKTRELEHARLVASRTELCGKL